MSPGAQECYFQAWRRLKREARWIGLCLTGLDATGDYCRTCALIIAGYCPSIYTTTLPVAFLLDSQNGSFCSFVLRHRHPPRKPPESSDGITTTAAVSISPPPNPAVRIAVIQARLDNCLRCLCPSRSDDDANVWSSTRPLYDGPRALGLYCEIVESDPETKAQVSPSFHRPASMCEEDETRSLLNPARWRSSTPIHISIASYMIYPALFLATVFNLAATSWSCRWDNDARHTLPPAPPPPKTSPFGNPQQPDRLLRGGRLLPRGIVRYPSRGRSQIDSRSPAQCPRNEGARRKGMPHSSSILVADRDGLVDQNVGAARKDEEEEGEENVVDGFGAARRVGMHRIGNSSRFSTDVIIIFP
ncbi:hypothetical protein C8F01DRAFT_1374001 [Mycena amicta]|nr:hypothetical protein C8F01DRAFT_1374001 [Mycena amicta]